MSNKWEDTNVKQIWNGKSSSPLNMSAAARTENDSCGKAKLGMRMVAAQDQSEVSPQKPSQCDGWVCPLAAPTKSIRLRAGGGGGEDKVRGGSKDVENKKQERSFWTQRTLVWEICSIWPNAELLNESCLWKETGVHIIWIVSLQHFTNIKSENMPMYKRIIEW